MIIIQLSFFLNSEQKKTFQIGKCYKLIVEKPNDKDINFDMESHDHKYCTVKCDCNPYAKFKCSKENKCKCDKPYSGEKM